MIVSRRLTISHSGVSVQIERNQIYSMNLKSSVTMICMSCNRDNSLCELSNSSGGSYVAIACAYIHGRQVAICSVCLQNEVFGNLDREEIGAVYYMHGDPFSDDEEVDRAQSIKRLRQANKLLPNSAEVIAALGYALYKSGMVIEARRLCARALQLDPAHFGHEKARRVASDLA